LPYIVQIVVEANTRLEALAKAEQAVKGFGDSAAQSNRQVANSAERGSRQAADAYAKLGASTKLLTNEKLGLQRAAGMVASNLVGLGPAGNVAANAILAVASGAGIAGAALGLVSTGVFLLIQRFQEAEQKKKDFDAALRTGNLSFFGNEIAAVDREIVDLDASIDEARRKVLDLRAAGIRPGGFEDQLLGGREKQGGDLDKRRAELLARQQEILAQKIQPAILALEFETVATRANAVEQERLAHELRVATALQGELKNAAQGTKDAFISQSEALRGARIGEVLKREREDQSRAIDQSRQSIMAQIEAVRLQTKESNEGAEAAALYKIANLANSEAVKKLGVEGTALLTILRDETVEFVRNAEAQKQARLQSEELAKSIAIAGQALEKQTDDENNLLREQLNLRTRLAEQAGDFELRKLRAAGAPEPQIVALQLEILRQQEEKLRNSPVITVEQNRRHQQLIEEIEIAEIQMQRLKSTGIDIAGEVSRVVTDITGAVISGTLKWADIGKSVLASFMRLALEQFTGFMRLMQTQSNAVSLAGGAGMIPGVANAAGGNGLGGGGFNPGGILSSLTDLFNVVGGRGGAPAGMAGPLMENGNFFSGGGGGVGSIISTVGGGISRLLPAGSSIGGALGGAFGGFGIGQMINGTPGGIAGAVGGAAGSLIGSSTAIGSALGIGAGSLAGGLTSLLTPMLGAMMAGLMSSFIIPGIGAIIAALMSLLSKPPDPAIWVKSTITFYYDQINEAFNQFTQTSLIKIQGDVKKSKIKQVIAQQQTILDTEAKRWVEVLNSFPTFIHEQMIGTLESANELLSIFFGRKKYSEGGKRNIQQELDDLKRMEAPRGVFAALRETIGVGLGGVLDVAGLGNAGAAAREAFPRWLIGQSENLPGVMIPTGSAEETEKFVEALKKMIGFTSALAKFAPLSPEQLAAKQEGRPWPEMGMENAGLAKFLTPQAIATIEDELAGVFSTTGTDFTQAVDSFMERMQPVQEFLAESVKQASELFGRGLIAAMEAATESDAKMAFLNSLSTGIKDMIFQGITSAFIASAQFTDLLAPIQKTIREFTEQALATGERPDIGKFRSAILPGIESISTRAEALAPLIEELRKLGLDIKSALALGGTNNNITINIGSMSDETDPRKLAEELGNYIGGLLPPT